jgi:hypothetical protein
VLRPRSPGGLGWPLDREPLHDARRLDGDRLWPAVGEVVGKSRRHDQGEGERLPDHCFLCDWNGSTSAPGARIDSFVGSLQT